MLTDVSCADAGYCAISGGYEGYYVRNGNLLGTVAPGYGNSEAANTSITCGAVYFCLLGTQNGDDDHVSVGGETYAQNGAAAAPASVGFQNVKADCASATFCAAVTVLEDEAGVGRG